MSLYEDLLQKQFLPHAYEDWAEYRNAISNYLIASTAADSTLAIFGAGCCNDWDLSLLAGHFSSITLIDNNLPAMKQALKRYQLETYPTIHLDECNLTGLYGSDYENFCDTLFEQKKLFGTSIDTELPVSTALAFLHQTYEKAKKHVIRYGSHAFDYSVAFGLHSQLNNMAAWIWDTIAEACHWQDERVTEYIASQTDEIVKRVNDTILLSTGKDAFFGNERTSSLNDSPVSGAMECILDIKKRYPGCQAALVPWNFNPELGVTYEMLLQHVTL